MINIKEIYTALITPFNEKKEIDFNGLYNLIKSLMKQGNTNFVLCGTTGEVSTLSMKEKKQLIQFVLYHFDKANFIIGISGNHTDNVISQIKELEDSIKDCPIMVVVPYYVKPSQQGLYCHFSKIAKCTKNQLILYNVPSRCSCNLEDETIIKLVKNHSNIIGLKQAGDYKTIKALKDKLPFFKVYSGNDDLLLEGLSQDVDGIISVCSHVAYPLIEEIMLSKDIQLDDKLKQLSSLVFKEASPGPIKYMLTQKGLINNILRLPLVSISVDLEKEIDNHS